MYQLAIKSLLMSFSLSLRVIFSFLISKIVILSIKFPADISAKILLILCSYFYILIILLIHYTVANYVKYLNN